MLDGWVEIRDEAAHDRARALARGSYQRALLDGYESLSGSTLRGRARDFAGRYAHSRNVLIERLRAAGIAVSERTGEHGRRILVIG